MGIKHDVELQFTFSKEDKASGIATRDSLHNQFLGNQDYIDSKIVISEKEDDEHYYVYLIIGNDANEDNVPDIISLFMGFYKSPVETQDDE